MIGRGRYGFARTASVVQGEDIPLTSEPIKTMKRLLPVLLIAGLLLAGCDLFDTSRNVEYIVSGSASSVFITYENEDGGTEQVQASPRWTYSFSAERDAFVYVSAQNEGESGTVEVEIRVDGDEFKSARATAAFGIAPASGSVP